MSKSTMNLLDISYVMQLIYQVSIFSVNFVNGCTNHILSNRKVNLFRVILPLMPVDICVIPVKRVPAKAGNGNPEPQHVADSA